MPRVPELFSRFQHYNDWRAKKKKRPEPMKSPLLKAFANDLFNLLSKPSIAGERWSKFRDAIEALARCLNGYSEYLNGELLSATKRQRLTHPPRQVNKNFNIIFALLKKKSSDICRYKVQLFLKCFLNFPNIK